MDGRRCAPKGNAHRGAGTSSGGSNSTSSSSGGKRKHAAGRTKKKPIKVLYIGNPMRVTTSAAGFRALVQELTGRHADPSKYCGDGGPIVDVDDGSSSGSLQAEPQQPGALAPVITSSPGGSTTEGSSDAAAAAACYGQQVPPAAQQQASTGGFGDDVYDDDETFVPQLIDNSYAVFSPPTFLYGYHYSDLM